MILDNAAQLANAYAPTSTGTASAPNYMDLQPPGLPVSQAVDGGMGQDWVWYTVVNVAFTTSAAGTLAIQLQGNATDPTFGSGNVIVDGPTQTVPAATLLKGFEGVGYGGWKRKYPRGSLVRYIRLQSIITTGAMTAGSLNSWLTDDAMADNQTYAAGYSVIAGG